MLALRKTKNRGFTIVELLIVIVVIGILATLVITTYNGIQEKARDTKRKTDINAIQGQLEAFQAQNGKYPSLDQMNETNGNTNWRAGNLKGLDPSALQDPKGSTEALCGTTTANCYTYATTPSNCNNNGSDCTGYTLTANLEDGTTYSKANLN